MRWILPFLAGEQTKRRQSHRKDAHPHQGRHICLQSVINSISSSRHLDRSQRKRAIWLPNILGSVIVIAEPE
jgi:hypothetical protein